jgi:peroxiredoxin
MKVRSFLVLLVWVLLAGGAWTARAASASSPAPPGPARTAPEFSLPDSDGKYVSLSSFRGKYVVIEIMDITCPHCQAASKSLEKMQLEYPNELQVLGIALRGSVVALTDYKTEFAVTYPMLQGNQKTLIDYLGAAEALGNFRIPIFFVVDPAGEIVQQKDPTNEVDKDFYNNPDPTANAADTGDAWLQKSLEQMIRQVLPAKPAAKPPAARAPAEKAPATKAPPAKKKAPAAKQ